MRSSEETREPLKVRPVRRLLGSARFIPLPALWVVLLVLGGMLFSRFVLKEMLLEDSHATCDAWVSELLAKNPDVLNLLTGAAPSAQTTNFLNESSQVGDIYRFRIWNPASHVVFKSERMGSPATPVEQRQVGRAFASGSYLNEVHKGIAPQNASYYVRSFIPVRQNGRVVGVFEIFLDQSDDEALYARFLFLTEIIIGGLVLLAGGIPAYGIYRQIRKVDQAKAQALFLSEHDGLTGIPNRHLLKDLAIRALTVHGQQRRQLAVLLIDMDRFKDINDSYGHPLGDKVLKKVAERLNASVRTEDTVARFGGDEFVVIQIDHHQPGGARSLAGRLIEVLAEPYDIDGRQVVCGASIGISISHPDRDDFDALIARADAALYKAKADGSGGVKFFEPGMDAEIRERHQIETDMRQALARGLFHMAYQPIHSLRNGRLAGFEALLRWPDGWPPKSPGEFIPIAEECGLMNRLGAWALETACKEAAGWPAHLKLAVNLSAVQFRDGNIASVIQSALSTSGFDPHRLEVEVTESVWIRNTDSVLLQLDRLRDLGIGLALDDFGTGFSSLSYLWKLPFDILKIDQSFVREIETDPKAAKIVETIAALGKSLNLIIAAEGVETPFQQKILSEAGCDLAQGYLYARPVPAASADALANAEPATGREPAGLIHRKTGIRMARPRNPHQAASASSVSTIEVSRLMGDL